MSFQSLENSFKKELHIDAIIMQTCLIEVPKQVVISVVLEHGQEPVWLSESLSELALQEAIIFENFLKKRDTHYKFKLIHFLRASISSSKMSLN